MTSSSQTHPGALPPETPPTRLSLRPGTAPAATLNADVPDHLVVHGPEPVMPECYICGDRNGPWSPCPQGRRYQSGAQLMYCRAHRPTPKPVLAAEGVIKAAMEHGAATPREWAQAEHDAGILFDSQAAADIAAAAAEQAHAEDEAEIAERGRQVALLAGVQRQLNAVMRLCEGRPGTHALPVAEIAAAAGTGNTPLDAFPMTLTWHPLDGVDIPGPGDTGRRAIVPCRSSYGQLAHLVVEGDDRIKLASLVDAEIRDIHAPCPTERCGTTDDYDPARMLGWARLEVAGIEDDAPRWYCTPQCVSAALARAGDELALDEEARLYPEAVIDLPYGELVDHLINDPDSFAEDEDHVASCTRCGCTDAQACEGGCAWVPNTLLIDLCSSCATQAELAAAGWVASGE